MFVIQITGGREFTDGSAIYNAMKPYIDKYGAKNIIVRHGKARGADSISHFQARKLGIPDDQIQARPVEFYGLSWDNNAGAGNQRNIAMLEEEPKPDVVLAFPTENSVGTLNMMQFAMERDIDVVVQGRKPATSVEKDLEFGLQQELSAAMLFADEIYPGSMVSRLPEYSDLDFVITWRGELKAFVEIKARRVSINAYNSTIMPLRKHMIAKSIYESLKIPTYAIIVFEDALVSFRLENEPDAVEYVGRDDRSGKGMDHGFYNHIRFTHHIKKG